MRITESTEQVYRAKISFDDLGEVSAASFDTQGKGCSIHFSLNRTKEDILELLFKSVTNSKGLPVGILNIGNIHKSNCEVHQDEELYKHFHGNITGPNQSRSLTDTQKSLLAAYCEQLSY